MAKFYSQVYCKNEEAGFMEFDKLDEAIADAKLTAGEWLEDGETAEIQAIVFIEDDPDKAGEPATHLDPAFFHTYNAV